MLRTVGMWGVGSRIPRPVKPANGLGCDGSNVHGTCRAVPGTDWHVPCTVADGRCPTKSRQAKACWYPSSQRPPLAEEAFGANQLFRAMSRTSCTACMPRDSSAA
jgi:hypothetical protein